MTRRAFLLGIIPAVVGVFQIVKGGMHHKIRSNDAGYISATEELSYPSGVGKVRTEMFLAHEYVHHVQKVMGFYHRKSINMGGALEGHARGVGKYMANLFSQERDDPTYLHDYLDRSIPELATAYVWLCRKLDTAPDAKLAQSARRFANETGGLSVHTLGNSLFKIYQRAKGQEMLSDMVHGRFVFPA